MNEQQEVILDNYKNPKNASNPDWEPTHKGVAQNLSCGDSIEIKLLVKEDVIKDIRFIGEGCSIAIASASMLTEKAKGQKVKEIKGLTIEDVLEIVGIELTMSRQKCALLSLDALQKAIG